MSQIYEDNLYKMLKVRGYELERDEITEEFSVDDLFVSMKFINEALGINEVRKLVTDLDGGDYAKVLVITGKEPASSARNHIAAIKDSLNIELYSANRLLIEIDHFFQPKWRIVGEDEKKEVVYSYHLVNTNGETDLDKAPLLFDSDPITLYYDAVVGDIDTEGTLFMLTRMDKSFNYRYVRRAFI